MSSHTVTLIKLGGSIITNKEVPMSLRKDVLKRLVREIATAMKAFPDEYFVVGHGQGSFGHVPAVKYETMNGFINDESRMGMAIVQDTAEQLNRIVVKEFIEQSIPAVSLHPSNSLVTKNRKADKYFVDVFEQYMRKGMLPVTGGDVIVDEVQGCTIWSTEEVLSFFAKTFQEKGWKVKQIIHVVEVDGVYDEQKHVIPLITKKNWEEVKKAVVSTKGFDVTGGMNLKIQESIDLAELHISSKILSGLKKDNLLNALTQKEWIGTEITSL